MVGRPAASRLLQRCLDLVQPLTDMDKFESAGAGKECSGVREVGDHVIDVGGIYRNYNGGERDDGNCLDVTEEGQLRREIRSPPEMVGEAARDLELRRVFLCTVSE